MKLTLTTTIKRLNNNYFLLFVCANFLFFLLYKYYQPLCELCLNREDCPPCISKEQYFIIYFGIVLNIAMILYYIFKKKK